MKQRILVWVTFSYILGLAVASQINLHLSLLLVVTGILIICWITASALKKVWAGFLLVLIFTVLGAYQYNLKENAMQRQLVLLPLGESHQVTATVTKGPAAYEKRTVYDLVLANGAKIRLNIQEQHPDKSYRYGDKLLIEGIMLPAKPARNPGEFDYRAYLRQQGAVAEITTAEDAVSLLGGPKKWGVMTLVSGVRERTLEAFRKTMSPRASAVAQALIFGDKSAVDQPVKEMFISLGIIHLMAVSGLHVGFVLLFIYFLKRQLYLKPYPGFLLTIGGLFIYTALTGFSPSVLRASVMALAVSLGDLVKREKDFYSSLAAAALAMLIYNPLYLFNSGFQLSFAAAWGLVYFYPLVDSWLGYLPNWRAGLSVPLTAQLAVLPLTAYYFNQISLIGILVNLLIIPAAGIMVISGLGSMVLLFLFPFFANGLLTSLGLAIDLLLAALNPLGQWPGSSLMVGTPSYLLIFSYYFIGTAVREWRFNGEFRQRWFNYRHRLVPVLLVPIAIFVSCHFLIPKPLEVVFLDVGQGDAIFIKTPGGQTVLLDGGGSPGWSGSDYRVGRQTVVPYLQRRGIKQLDLMISSHPDQDHLQGLEDVLTEMRVKTMLRPPQNLFSSGYEVFDGLAEAKGIRQLEGAAGDFLRLDHGIILEILSPPRSGLKTHQAPDNNNSLVIKVTYGSTQFLLTGDAEEEALTYLLSRGKNAAVDVFKAPHHGSRTGLYQPFLDRLSPEAVVISVGKNSFGHPAPEVIEYWNQTGSEIFRTDRDGAVMIYSNGKTVEVKRFLADRRQSGGI